MTYKNKKDIIAARKRYYRKHKAAIYQRKLQRKVKKAGGRQRPHICDVCGCESFRIVFDHCHQTGKFRGWICWGCNIVLGHVKDDPNILWKLGLYLKQNQIYGRQV